MRCPDLQNPHGFLSREGGISEGLYASLNCGVGSDDIPAYVHENRRIAAEIISGSAETPLLSCYQVHGSTALTITETWAEDWAGERPQADAMVTDRPGLILGILTADCTPVLFEDADAGVIGAAHAGWKGAFCGILESTVAAMERLGAERSRIRAAIGPTIAQASYEVDAGFRDTFLSTDESFGRFFLAGRDAGHFQFNLPAFAHYRLESAGVTHIWDSGIDTYTSPDHFSFRRTTHCKEPDYGRQLSGILLRP